MGICGDGLNGFGATNTDGASGDGAKIAAHASASPKARPHVSVIINLHDLTTKTGHGVTEHGTPLTARNGPSNRL